MSGLQSVTVDKKALSDHRVKRLARLIGTDVFGAIGRLIYVWSYCTDEETEVVDLDTLANLTDCDTFGASLVEAKLGEEEPSGIRIKGTADRIYWLAARREAAAKGGQANRARIERKRAGAKPEPKQSQQASHEDSHVASTNVSGVTLDSRMASQVGSLVLSQSASQTLAKGEPNLNSSLSPSGSPGSPLDLEKISQRSEVGVYAREEQPLRLVPPAPPNGTGSRTGRRRQAIAVTPLLEHREAAERLWRLQDALRAEAFGAIGRECRPLKATTDSLGAVAEILVDYSEADAEHVLRVYAAETRAGGRNGRIWFDGTSNWVRANFKRALGQDPNAIARATTHRTAIDDSVDALMAEARRLEEQGR